MAYVSLYRKYRSQTFAEIIGQDHVTHTLASAVAGGRVHHAYLFTGPRGTGKTSTARILAKALNCVDGPTAQPCNACDQCVAITEGSAVDVIEIDAASHGGVDDVRDLRERVAFAPLSARTKVYIVDECHMLSTAGWNAFLKTVEEPPGHVVFVFATTEPHKVLDTILSRTQRFDFKRLTAAALAGHVRDLGAREGLELDAGAVELIVRAGDGSARDTLSVLDQVIAYTGTTITAGGVAGVLGTVPNELLDQTAAAMAAGDVAALCVLVQHLADAGTDLRQFARDSIAHLHTLFLLRVAPDAGLVAATGERRDHLVAQARALGHVELLRAIDLLGEALAQMRRGNTRLPLEVALAKAAMPESSGDPAALAARLDRLERLGPLPARAPAQPTPEPVPPEPVEPEIVTPAPVEPEIVTPEPVEREVVTPEVATPEHVAPAPRAQAPATDATDLTAVTERWDAFLEVVRRRKPKLHAFLLQGELSAADGDGLVVRFARKWSFHAGEVSRPDHQALLTELCGQVFGSAWRIRTVLVDDGDAASAPSSAAAPTADDAEAEAVAETEAAEADGSLPDAATAHAEALATLRRDLGARVVDPD